MNDKIFCYVLSSPDQEGRRYHLYSTHLEQLPLCMGFMRLVVEGGKNFRPIRLRRNGDVIEGPTALDLHDMQLHDYWRLFRRHYTFHPYVVLFLRVYREHAIRHLHGLLVGASDQEVLQDFVQTLSTEAKACRLRKRAADWRGKFERNADRLIDLMGRFGERSQNQTVIELELNYVASRLSPEEATEMGNVDSLRMEAEWHAYKSGWNLDRVEPAPVKVPFEEVQRDRLRLCANLKGKPALFNDLMGYVWRIQFTPVTGYSLRLSLIFDGTDVDHAGLGEEIGQYWGQNITQGRGCFQQLKPWPAIDAARRLAVLSLSAQTERKWWRQELMGRLGGPLLAAQVLPHPGCNLFGTGLVHGRPATRRPSACSRGKPTGGRA